MTFNNAIRTTSLLAVVLLAVPAYAGTATYLGTHTAGAGDVLIDGTARTFAPGDVTYAGGVITVSSTTAGFSDMILPKCNEQLHRNDGRRHIHRSD